MPDTKDLSEAKQALLKKLLQGEHLQATPVPDVMTPISGLYPGGRHERALMVQAGGSKRPFFFLHGDWTGRASYCYPLARHLGADQPFYVLEPYRFDDLPAPPSYEEMAAAHLKTMRAIQPEGPYLLGGWCNGGLLAYEIALQLLVEGQKVDLLVLMDSDAPHPANRRLLRTVICRSGDFLHISKEKQFNMFLRIQYLYRCARFKHYRQRLHTTIRQEIAREQKFHNRSSLMSRLHMLSYSFMPPIGILRQEWTAFYDWVTLGYVPRELYPGKINFFWDEEDTWRPVWWRNVEKAKKGQMETHVIPGSHITIRTDNLHMLAEQLRLCIDSVQNAP